LIGVVSALAAMALGAPSAMAQLPLAPVSASGQSVTPVFEGWYRNRDGTYSISFGYFNRNAREVLEIPVGEDNFVSPGPANQGQPTHFQPRRHWGVFTVNVPAGFGDRKVTWTLRIRGETHVIPGNLHPDWQIDAIEGEAGSGNTPPLLRFAPGGPVAQGPGGYTAGPMTVAVGKPLTVDVWAADDGRTSGSVASGGRAGVPVTLVWFKHQGPGDVTISPATPRPAPADGKATATVTFSAPGEYVLRVRANDASGVAGAGHAQCCWTNGFVKVTVTP
jgi:hypothetical protein